MRLKRVFWGFGFFETGRASGLSSDRYRVQVKVEKSDHSILAAAGCMFLGLVAVATLTADLSIGAFGAVPEFARV